MKEIGDKGERIAARALKKRGYKIIETNYSVHHVGEIDIVAKKDEYLVFVEVKYRKNTLAGRPEEYVGRLKRQRLLRAAEQYILTHGVTAPVRFDVVSVIGNFIHPEVEVITNAFGDM